MDGLSTVTSNSSHAKKFSHNLLKLIEQIQKLFPNEKRKFMFFQFKVKFLCTMNVKMPCRIFLSMMGGMIKPIMTRDVNFFMNFDYDEEFNRVSKDFVIDRETHQNFMDLITRIMVLYRETEDPKIVDLIGTYVELLLCHAILALRREDLLEELNQYRKVPLVLS